MTALPIMAGVRDGGKTMMWSGRRTLVALKAMLLRESPDLVTRFAVFEFITKEDGPPPLE